MLATGTGKHTKGSMVEGEMVRGDRTPSVLWPKSKQERESKVTSRPSPCDLSIIKIHRESKEMS